MQASRDGQSADGRTVEFHTLGCKVNHAETSVLAEQFSEAGFHRRLPSEASDVVVINSCTVTNNADRECRQIIRRALRSNPDAFVVVTGCYAQLAPEEIASIDGVDLVVGSAEKHRLLSIETSFRKRDYPRIVVSDPAGTDFGPGQTSDGDAQTRAYLKVQDGCDYTCSFCTIPLARGASRSASIVSLVEQARRLVGQGFKEIVLTGVNVGDYGKAHGIRLVDLLQHLHDIDGLARLRISSIEPNLLEDRIIRLAVESDRLVPHFHIPLQSGCDAVLARMRRRYRSSFYREIVERLVGAIPEVAVGVDVIAGFPGEREVEFAETLAFLEALPAAYFHVFTYSERDNTPAAAYASSVPALERRRRTQVLRDLSERKKRQFAARFVGSVRNVLFESGEGGQLFGYTDNYLRVSAGYHPTLPNTIVPVALGSYDGSVVEGKVMHPPGDYVAIALDGSRMTL